MDVKQELRGIFALLKKNIPGAEPRLHKLLNDREPEVRYEVAKAIGEKQFLPFAKRIAERLAEEEVPSVRSALIHSCGEVPSSETLDVLLTIAKKDRKKRTEERGRILFALSKHRSEDAREYFEAIFATDFPDSPPPFDHHKEERVLAAWALMKLGNDDLAHAFLVAMLEDPPSEVLDALGEVKATDPGVSQRARQALIDLGLMTRRSRMPPPPPPSSRSSERKIKLR